MSSESDHNSERHSRAFNRNLLIFTLLNPTHKDAGCIHFMVEALRDSGIGREDRRERLPGPILRAGMKFICATRSIEDGALLEGNLSACRCKPAIREGHAWATDTYPPVVAKEIVLQAIVTETAKYLLRASPGKFRKRKGDAPPEEQPWPCCIEDLILVPDGECDVLCAICKWASPLSIPHGHIVFVLIGALARFWQPLANKLFLTPLVLELASEHMQHAIDTYDPHADIAVQTRGFLSPIISCVDGLLNPLRKINTPLLLLSCHALVPSMLSMGQRAFPIVVDFRKRGGPKMDDIVRWFSLMKCHSSWDTMLQEDDKFAHAVRLDIPKWPYLLAFQYMNEIRDRNEVRCSHSLS